LFIADFNEASFDAWFAFNKHYLGKNMIIVRLIGGLGNQMFQYAAGRYLSLKHDTELKFDIYDYHLFPDRGFKLFNFNIVGEKATQEEIDRLRKRSLLDKILIRVTGNPNYPRTFFMEREGEVNYQLFSLPDNVYLYGYFQKPDYFSSIRDTLINEFTPSEGLVCEPIMQEMAAVNSISVHIRRGDYVTDKNANQRFGVCSLDYYKNACKYIINNVIDPRFYIFSDDPSWVRSNFDFLDDYIIVSEMDYLEDFQELVLMSKCKHNIIANSSFSWWGAWLNPNEEKFVIAPKSWYRNGNSNEVGLMQDWLQIEG
jgi:hypothetical protein